MSNVQIFSRPKQHFNLSALLWTQLLQLWNVLFMPHFGEKTFIRAQARALRLTSAEASVEVNPDADSRSVAGGKAINFISRNGRTNDGNRCSKFLHYKFIWECLQSLDVGLIYWILFNKKIFIQKFSNKKQNYESSQKLYVIIESFLSTFHEKTIKRFSAKETSIYR